MKAEGLLLRPQEPSRNLCSEPEGPIQTPQPVSLRTILMFFHLRLGLPNYPMSGFATEIL
jgi:hypothetical protein